MLILTVPVANAVNVIACGTAEPRAVNAGHITRGASPITSLHQV